MAYRFLPPLAQQRPSKPLQVAPLVPTGPPALEPGVALTVVAESTDARAAAGEPVFSLAASPEGVSPPTGPGEPSVGPFSVSTESAAFRVEAGEPAVVSPLTVEGAGDGARAAEPADRKSTRLNSSHQL